MEKSRKNEKARRRSDSDSKDQTQAILLATCQGLDLIPRSDEPDHPVKTCHGDFELERKKEKEMGGICARDGNRSEKIGQKCEK